MPEAADNYTGIDAYDDRTELVIALVSPIGADSDSLCDALSDSLEQIVGYKSNIIRITSLFNGIVPETDNNDVNRYRHLMDVGDELREKTGEGAICAMLSVAAICDLRARITGSEDKPIYNTATILRSLKHPAEVKFLRQVYGRRVLVVGISEERSLREDRLRKELLGTRHTSDARAEAAGEATALMLRDEKDELRPLGQRVRDTYALCDVYLPSAGEELATSARRLIELMFGRPFITPTRDEMGLWHAYAAKFRSSAAGRQVGVAILDSDGEVLVTGCNDVPAPGGGQNWEGDTGDHRDFAEFGKDVNDSKKFELTTELFSELRDSEWLSAERQAFDAEELATQALGEGLHPLLENTRIANLLEFGRIMHAEMAALMTASRRGTPVRHATLYSTTYPCHECMRLIIGAGIERVVYIDPYPKSLVAELFSGHLTTSNQDHTMVQLDRFVGVAPRLVPRVFAQMKTRKRDIDGTYEKWKGRSADYIGSEDRYAETVTLQEARAGEVLGEHLAVLQPAERGDTGGNQ